MLAQEVLFRAKTMQFSALSLWARAADRPTRGGHLMIEGHAETVLEFLGSGPVYWCAISHRDNHRNCVRANVGSRWGQSSALIYTRDAE